MKYDYLIVGAGPSGCVMAERLANEGLKVLVIDKRNHIAGNCYDYFDINGVLTHKYGAHLFRTDKDYVVKYLNRFGDWFSYKHRVQSYVKGKYFDFPININTINKFFNKNYTNSADCKLFIDSIRDKNIATPRNLEEKVVSQVGWDLYRAFYNGYTKKQWGQEPSKLDPSIVSRIDVHYDDNDNYHSNKYTLMPSNGFTNIFAKMLDHKNISIQLNTCFNLKNKLDANKVLYTGSLDKLFNYKYGRLPYRSLKFTLSRYDVEYKQPVCVINYPNNFKFTRSIEIKHATGQKIDKTTVIREYPTLTGEPYYLTPSQEGLTMYQYYLNEKETVFGERMTLLGRLAEYKYISMDQAIDSALIMFEKMKFR